MAIGHINEVAALTEFSYDKTYMYGCSAGQKNTGRNNEVTIQYMYQ